MEFDVDLMIPDQKLSIAEGAIQVFGWQSSTDKKSYTRAILDALAREYHFDLETPLKIIHRKSKMFYCMELVAEKSKSIIKGREAKVSMMWHLKGSSKMLEEDIVRHLRI